MGGTTPSKEESQSTSSSNAQQFAPIQMGAKSPISALGDKNYSELVNGLYSYIKGYVTDSMQQFQPEQTAGKISDLNDKIQNYQDKASQIADQMMTGFAQNVSPDAMQTFPLDDFIQNNLQSIYSDAKSLFDKPMLDRNEVKSLVDAQTSTMATQFTAQRQAMQQNMRTRGIDPNSAAGAAAQDKAETDIARAKGDTTRQVVAQQIGNKQNVQLAALGQMGQATGQAQSYVGQQSQRWLGQWSNKLQEEGLRQSGLQLQLGANAQAAGLAQQQYGNLWNQMNYPLNVVTGAGLPFLQTLGQQDISAHSGASQSSSTSQSTGSGTGESGGGSFGLPFGIWNQKY